VTGAACYDVAVTALVPCHPAGDAFWLDRDALIALGKAHRAAYAAARPFPHVVLDGLLGEARSRSLARAFPSPAHPGWKRRDYPEQAARLGQLQRTGFAGVAGEVRALLGELTGMAFLDFLAALTGREDLIADPHYRGAGLLATLPGGKLALHADFNRDGARHVDRVATALYYLPVEWDDAWGGELELWDAARTRCEVQLAPRRDRLVIMAYGDDHWHGHPSPVRCPPPHVRAVVAAHYYAARPDAAAAAAAHGAIWVEPGR
jgi:hypothetical protein